LEAKESQRNEYQRDISGIAKENLVYVDESGIDRTSYKNRGWGKKGEVLLGKTSGKRFIRTNIIAAQCGKNILAPMTFKGTCDTELFVDWVRMMLVRELKPGQTVVMDNASFHKSHLVREAIEAAGCRLVYLPPYSPDLNPIEKFWANLKRWINQYLPHMEDIHKAICFFFKCNSSL
jgi:transposase